MYSLSCKKHTSDRNMKPKITKNNKPYALAKCGICGKNKSKFVSIKEIRANGVLSNLSKHFPISNKIF